MVREEDNIMEVLSDGKIIVYREITEEEFEKIKKNIELLDGKIVRVNFTTDELGVDVKFYKFKFSDSVEELNFTGDTCGISKYESDFSIKKKEIKECSINKEDKTFYCELKSNIKIFISYLKQI